MLPKRKKYLLFSLILTLFMTLFGCSSERDSNPKANTTNGEQEVISGGELTYALATDPDTLDPHVSSQAVATRVIKSIFESLVYQDFDNEIKPWLATEWELSEDQKEYTFHLREGITFHDGSPFDAEVVKYNFERIFDPSIKALFARTYMEMLESVEVIDTHKIKFVLKEPSATFLTTLAHSNFSIVSKKAAEEFGEQFGLNPVGTGPFEFVEAVENNHIKLEKNENYKGYYPFTEREGTAYLDRLTFKIIPEEATRIGSVQSGQIMAAETVPPQDVLAIKNNDRLNLLEAETGGLSYTLFINNTNPPWDNIVARQALRAGIDVGKIVETLYLGTYQRAWSPLAPSSLGYDSNLEGKESFDIKKANELFDELGWKQGADGFREKDGKILTLRILNMSINREKRQDITLMIKEQLKEVGVDVKIETTSEVVAVLNTPTEYDAYGNNRVGLDPDDLRPFYHSEKRYDNGGNNMAWYKNEALDKILEAGAVEIDNAKRIDLYKQAQQIIIDHVVSIPIYLYPYTVATTTQVDGVKFDSLGYPLFFDANITE